MNIILQIIINIVIHSSSNCSSFGFVSMITNFTTNFLMGVRHALNALSKSLAPIQGLGFLEKHVHFVIIYPGKCMF